MYEKQDARIQLFSYNSPPLKTSGVGVELSRRLLRGLFAEKLLNEIGHPALASFASH